MFSDRAPMHNCNNYWLIPLSKYMVSPKTKMLSKLCAMVWRRWATLMSSSSIPLVEIALMMSCKQN